MVLHCPLAACKAEPISAQATELFETNAPLYAGNPDTCAAMASQPHMPDKRLR